MKNFFRSLLESFFKKDSETVGVDHAPNIYPGVLLDTRPAEIAEMDPSFGEIVAKADAVEWRDIPKSDWPVYGRQDQNGQSSCVANAGRKAMRVMFRKNHNLDIDASSLDIYRRRFNYPAGGMSAFDLWKIMSEGVTLNAIVPSDNKTEAAANSLKMEPWMRAVGDVFKIRKGINLPISIDSCASVMQRTGKAVVLFFYFTAAEWSREVPIVIDRTLRAPDDRALRHAVAGIIYTLHNGQKALVIDDSALFGGLDRRIITEEFFKARCFYAGYPMNFVFGAPDDERPIHRFDRDIPFGESSDEVKILQKCLQFEGFFPKNVDTTGLYGGVTADAVLAFQKKYAVASPSALDRLAGKNVGPATRDALNRIFA